MSTPEGAVLRSILDYLAVKRVLAYRLNTGAMSGEHKGKRWFMRFGAPGMADLIALPKDRPALWIECKAPKGKQSELQKAFQAQVEAAGCAYVLARSIDDVEPWVR